VFQRIFPAIFLFASIILANAQATSAPGKPLPPGPAQAKVKAACTQCHNASRITGQHMTRQQWSGQLEKMEGLGAVIPDSDRNAFLNYLTRNFRSRKRRSQGRGKGRRKDRDQEIRKRSRLAARVRTTVPGRPSGAQLGNCRWSKRRQIKTHKGKAPPTQRPKRPLQQRCP